MTAIDQKAYLQKYLSQPSKDKKKKRKSVKGKGFKIIDDDIDVSKLRPLDCDELDLLNQGEDAPQIAGIIDERPEELRLMEEYRVTSKWKVINEDDGFDSKLQVQEIKKTVVETQKENELIFGKMYSDSEDERQNDSDVSPPRKQKDTKCTSPFRSKSGNVKEKERNYDSDLSPPRKSNRTPNKDASPTRRPNINERKRKNSDSDLSPPRPSHKKHSEDRRKRKQYSDSDFSPPRNRRRSEKEQNRKEFEDSLSQKQVSKRHVNNSDSDLSPPRRNDKKMSNRSKENEINYDSDPSPSRKCNDIKKPVDKIRKPSRWGSHDRSESHSKRDLNADSDSSPPRKSRRRSPSPMRSRNADRRKDTPPPTHKKMAKTLDGKTAGLQDAKQLRDENSMFRKREDDAYTKLSDDVSGRNAQAVSRKLGKRETSEERRKQKEKAERQRELDEKYKKWSKGMKQVEAEEDSFQNYLYEASKPLARFRDDRDLEEGLRQRDREGDPMMGYIRDKKRDRGELPPDRPSYRGSFPPNRFDIKPGYRWDGVDRSNGYENKLFAEMSRRRAQDEEVYKWSTEDL